MDVGTYLRRRITPTEMDSAFLKSLKYRGKNVKNSPRSIFFEQVLDGIMDNLHHSLSQGGTKDFPFHAIRYFFSDKYGEYIHEYWENANQ